MSRRDIYLRILYLGLLDIRNNCDDKKQVFAQSDHLHNLPNLLCNFDDEEQHDYYWNFMRPHYLSKCSRNRANMFDDLWSQLENLRTENDETP